MGIHPAIWVLAAVLSLALVGGVAVITLRSGNSTNDGAPSTSAVTIGATSPAAPPTVAAQAAAPTPVPTPPGPIVYRKQVSGEGAIAAADFKFSIAERDNGFKEGWLIHAVRSGGPRFEASAINSVEVSGQSASVWGVAAQVGSPESYPFNLIIDPRSYKLVILTQDGKSVLQNEGPLVGGSVTVTAR